jgi:hypothetical protein
MTVESQSETLALQKAILESKAARAGSVSPGLKMMEGVRLFDSVRERVKAGIRSRNPDWSEELTHQEFLNQLEKQRRHAEKGIYRLIGYVNDDGTITPVTSEDENTDER